jgi:hypothetical protein
MSVGRAGTFSEDQVFTATQVGTNTIYVSSGAVAASTTISVVGQRGPVLESVVVNPLRISASGGVLTMTVAATDGGGVVSVVATIYPPDAPSVEVPLHLVAGDARTGTYRGTWDVPPNSNIPNASGVQAQQAYTLRIAAKDITSRQTLSDYIGFAVRGLVAPPPPPT